MGKKLRNWFVVCVVFLGLYGCQTTSVHVSDETGESTKQTEYGYFHTPADHLEELVSEGKLQEASEVYNKNHEFFDENFNQPNKPKDVLSSIFSGSKEKEQKAIIKLAKSLSQTYEPQLKANLHKLENMNWPAPKEEWASVKKALLEAKALIDDIASHKILEEPKYKIPEVRKLSNTRQQLVEDIKASASDQFTQVAVGDLAIFENTYPVEIDINDLFAKRFGAIREKLLQAPPEQLCEINKAYEAKFSAECKQQLAKCYFDKLIASEGTNKSGDFGKLIRAIAKTQKDGFNLAELPESRIALIEVTSPTLKKQRSIEFPVAIEKDLPFKVEKCDLDKSFDTPISKSADVLVMLNITVARTERNIVKQDRVSSERQTGTKQVVNPMYKAAQAEAEMARMHLNQAQMNAAMPSGGGLIGLALVIAKVEARDRAQQNYQMALAQVASTPETIDEPVYSPYKLTKAKVDVAKEAVVTYYIIDRKSYRYIKRTFDAKQTKTFTVAYNLHENDKFRSTHLKDTQTEEDIDKFEQTPIVVYLSDILSTYTDKKRSHKKLASMQQIRKDIIKDRNAVLTREKKRKFTATPRNDARFNSVVVVYHPGGALGTGFYVADDLVLTNYHVIEGVKFLELKLYDGQETFGKVYAKDIRLDLALLKVQARGNPVSFFKGQDLPIGERVEAVGHPKGLEYSITRGITSALRKIHSNYLKGGKKVDFIQTDVAVNPGNSGGPLFIGNKVVGVITQKLAATEIEGLSFAVHYGEVQNFLKSNKVAMR